MMVPIWQGPPAPTDIDPNLIWATATVLWVALVCGSAILISMLKGK